MRRSFALFFVLALPVSGGIYALGCGGDDGPGAGGGGSGGGKDATADGNGTGGGDDSGNTTGDDGAPPNLFGDTGADACLEGLKCLQVNCPDGGPRSTLSGTVYDPAGKDPVYNALVFVPTAPLDAIATGATCDKCNGGNVSGKPLVSTLTNARGEFSLQDVPIGSNIPLVVQVGKWRRKVTIPSIATACGDNHLTDHNLTRLPRNASEGDMPKIAVATGGKDP